MSFLSTSSTSYTLIECGLLAIHSQARSILILCFRHHVAAPRQLWNATSTSGVHLRRTPEFMVYHVICEQISILVSANDVCRSLLMYPVGSPDPATPDSMYAMLCCSAKTASECSSKLRRSPGATPAATPSRPPSAVKGESPCDRKRSLNRFYQALNHFYQALSTLPSAVKGEPPCDRKCSPNRFYQALSHFDHALNHFCQAALGGQRRAFM